ncbi:MAG: trigger factor [Patescibacteria group bacterium]|jgi:trigger factor
MQVTKKDLDKSQIELLVELTPEEFAPYIVKGVEKVSKDVKIEGFRPGKVPFDILKQKIGEMTILEEAAHIAINKTIDEVIMQNTMERRAIGQPQVNVTKLAPNNPLEYKIILSLLPTVALGKYKDLELKTEEAKIDNKELDKALNDLREMRAKEEVVERAVEEGDKVTADIKMFLDKVPLEDGQHKDLAILLGKDYFVPGFDHKLIGAKKDEIRKFLLPYPDDHHQKNLAGKMVEFEVKIKDVYSRTLPGLNDELAVIFQLKDLEELKKNLRESLLHEKKHQVDAKNEAALLTKIIEDTKFGELPEILINAELKNMLEELEQNITRQGGKFDDYLQHLKKDRAALMLELTPNAIKRVKSALAIREMALVEKISPTDKEIHEKIEDLKKQYANNQEVLKMLEEPGYHSYLENILTNEKVIAKLKDWNYAPTDSKQKS